MRKCHVPRVRRCSRTRWSQRDALSRGWLRVGRVPRLGYSHWPLPPGLRWCSAFGWPYTACRRESAMRVPRIAFDIMLLAFYLVTANPATTGMPLHEYLGVGVFVLMVAHVVMSGEGLGGRGRWTARAQRRAAGCTRFLRRVGDHGVGGAASLLGPLCDWLLFLGSRARPFRQSTTSRPARSYCSAYTGGYVGVSPSFLQFFR